MSTSTDQQTAVRYEKDADGIVTLTLDDPTARANTMNELYIESMAAAVDRLHDELAADPQSVTGVVVASAKKTFFAGGNLNKMVQATKADAADVFATGERVKAALRRLEQLPRPVVAAINGAALGGGLEIALACNHRIVVDDPSVQLGLPEASLGLLPGGGGVTRVVRMLGIQSALMDVLLQGTRFRPAQALGEGPGRRAGRHPRGAGPGREGVDQGQPDAAAQPVGPARVQDAGRHAQQPQARGVPAGLPRPAAPADQGRGLPGPARDPLRRRRGRPGRLRHRVAGSSRAT